MFLDLVWHIIFLPDPAGNQVWIMGTSQRPMHRLRADYILTAEPRASCENRATSCSAGILPPITLVFMSLPGQFPGLITSIFSWHGMDDTCRRHHADGLPGCARRLLLTRWPSLYLIYMDIARHGRPEDPRGGRWCW